MSQKVTVEPLGVGDPHLVASSHPPVSVTPLTSPKPSGPDSNISPGRHVIVEPLPTGLPTPRLVAEAGIAPSTAPAAATSGTEPEDWISKLIEYLWPKIRRATEDIAWDTVPPILDESRPSWVHGLRMTKFELGAKEPDLRRVRCFVNEEEGGGMDTAPGAADLIDDVFIEFDIDWVSKQDVEIQLQVLGKDVASLVPNFIENRLAEALTMTVGVEDCCVKGTVQLALRPLLHRTPIVAAVQAAFTTPPAFDFTPTLEGGFGNALHALLPSVKAWLKTTVQDAILGPYVLPEHFFLPLDPGAPDLQRPLGFLRCRVLEAVHVPRMDPLGGSDTFVEAFIRHSQRHTTRVISHTRHPIWDEEFLMPVHSVAHQKLRFVLWDYDALSPNDEIGRCEVAVRDLQEGGAGGAGGAGDEQGQEIWLDVVSEGEEERKSAKHGERGIQYSTKDRVLRALAQPIAGHSTNRCALKVEIFWRRWTEEEADFIQRAVRRGVRRSLEAPDGRDVDPGLRELLLGGAVHAVARSVRGAEVSGLFGRPSLKMVVKVAGLEAQETPPFKVNRRGAADLSGAPLQLNVPGRVAGRAGAELVIEFKEVGFMSGGDVVGALRMTLRRLMDEGCVEGTQRLVDGMPLRGKKGREEEDKGPVADLEIRWVGTFT